MDKEEIVPLSILADENTAHYRQWVGTFADGSQLMVNLWFDAEGNERGMTAATRPSADRSIVWGPPITLELE